MQCVHSEVELLFFFKIQVRFLHLKKKNHSGTLNKTWLGSGKCQFFTE